MKLRLKKMTAICASVVIGITLIPETGVAYGEALPMVIPNANQAESAYVNPQDIIISQPGTAYTTSGSKVSILGACDYRYPLYMNGVAVKTTEHGFFAAYVDLIKGNNAFTFTNNGKTKTVNITKKSSSGGGSGAASQGINYWSKSHPPKYAVAKGQNISRMSTPGGDKKSMMIPLAQGTMAQIIGETGDLYCLSDYSLVYKSNVTVKDGTLGNNFITGVNFTDDNGLGCTELQFTMPQKALYNLEKNDTSAMLTIFNMNGGAWCEIPQNNVIKSVDIIENGGKGYVKYLITFQKDAPISGHYVEFKDGKMLVGFKELPTLNGDNLEGVRVHIDPGHGGSDIGAKGALSTFGPLEKDINLGIALSAKSYLESRGATVIMTRTGDTVTELSARAANVAAVKPDFSLSVHCNSMPVTANYNNAKGFLTFYSFNDMGAAEYINSYITNKMGVETSAPRYSNLAMTRMTGYPAVLFETSFMSNPEDYEMMIKTETQKQFGIAAGEAVENFIMNISQKNEATEAIYA